MQQVYLCPKKHFRPSCHAQQATCPPSYGTFISNYHMHGMDKKLTELHGMLKVAEQDIKKGTHQVLMVQKSAKFKKSWSKKKAKAKGTETVILPAPASSCKYEQPIRYQISKSY